MKKSLLFCLVILLVTVFFCGCQSDAKIDVSGGEENIVTEAVEPTTEPAVAPTEAAEPTTEPTVAPTEAAEPTAEPTVAPTEAVEPTTEPTVVPTEAAEPTTEPTVAPTETEKPTVTPVPTVRLVEHTYDFNELFGLGYSPTCQVNTDGSMQVQFEDQYHEVKFVFPEDIDMTYCHKIVVKVKCEYAPMSIKLYDKTLLSEYWAEKAYEYYECSGNGIREYEFSPDENILMAGIGFMSLNRVEDYSKYTATIYSISLFLEEGYVPQETETDISVIRSGDVTYKFADLEIIDSNIEYTKNEDGSIQLDYGIQGEDILFRLPEGIDTRYCTGIQINYQIENCLYFGRGGNVVSVNYYDKTLLRSKDVNPVFADLNLGMNGPKKSMITPKKLTELYGIGIAGNDSAEKFDVVLQSITFRMVSQEKAEIPKDIAPDVTADMTLLNTYGNVFEKIGTGITIEDARHPEVMKVIKRDFNTVGQCAETAQDFIFGMHNGKHKFISVEEAKREGYTIPDNYKDEVVPILDMSTVDEFLKICAENDLYVRYHGLICYFHDESNWFFNEGYSESGDFASPEVMDARLEFYIRNVMEHVYDSEYGYVVYAWELVNEYFHAEEGNFLGVYGDVNLKPEHVKLAFTVADDVLKQYGIRDQVALIYNDYHTFYVDEVEDTPQSLIDIIEFVNSDGKVCDGIGMQGYMGFAYPKNIEDFKVALLKFLNAGLDVYITEMGFSIDNPDDPKEVAAQEEIYCWLFEQFLEIKSSGGRLMEVNLRGAWDDASEVPENDPYLWNYPGGKPKDVYYKILQTYMDEGYEVK